MNITLHSNHIKDLSYRYVKNNTKETRCEKCGGKIWGNAFTCLRCRVWLHAPCSDKLHCNPPPREINHPLHSRHQLKLERHAPDFICDKCLRISVGYRYGCSSCAFNLDFACASSADGRFPKDQESLRFEDGRKKTIQHYSHSHKLSVFIYRMTDEEDNYCCFWCEKHLWEVCYGCLNCGFYLHQACADKVPRLLISHPFHPDHGHTLRLSSNPGYCGACKNISTSFSPSYKCQMCNFRLDFHCSKLSPSLKLDRHPHLLTYFKAFGNDYGMQDFSCKACGKHCGGASVNHCVECNFSLHLKCAVPSPASNKYHRHPLVLMESIKEDDSGEYYCDVCEMERNPRDPVYCCQSCTFIAHIQCVLDEDQTSSRKVSSSSLESMERKALLNEMEHNEGTNIQRDIIQPTIHSHQLYEVTGKFKKNKICQGCRLLLDGPCYFCKTCPDFCLHAKCAKLPYKIQHPFHSSHSLNLFTTNLPLIGQYITCDECRVICFGFIYLCELCNFKLDLKCAALITHRTGGSQEKEMDRVNELHHFSHHHKLVLGYYNESNGPIDETECTICELPILGPAYFCPERYCDYILHESCLKLPQKIQVPFHPEHELVIHVFKEHSKPKCYACPFDLKLDTYAYSCEHCHLNLHPICASSLRRPLKCDSHLHDLYYFGTNFQLLSENYGSSWAQYAVCCECGISCKKEAFYRCLQCDNYFHLKCVPIPDFVKSKYHRHPLTLKDSFVEDDSGNYYCDFCEKERDPKDHVYYCQECNGQTIAHIECVLAQVEDNMVEIRKNFREESLQKKGLGRLQAQLMPASLHPAVEKKLENLPAMVDGVWSDDRELQLKATIQFRRLLSIESEPFIEDVIQVGVVPRFVEFLLKEDFPRLQFEAAGVLEYIASGTTENKKVVIDHGAVPIFIKLLDSPDDGVREQVARALGVVARDSPKFRDLVLDHGALLPLLAQLNEHSNLFMLRFASWTLKNLCCSKPQPPPDQVKLAIPALARLIHSKDDEVLGYACLALAFLCDGKKNDKIQAVIEAGVCGRLVELLLHPSHAVLVPTLITIGNIIKGGDVQTQSTVSRQALPCLFNLLTNNNNKLIKSLACVIIPDITWQNKEQIQAVIEANIIAPLVHLLQNAESEMKNVAMLAIFGAMMRGTHDQIKFLVSQGCIKPVCDLLNCPDPDMVRICLKGLENILKVGEADKTTTGTTGGVNLYAEMIDDAEGREKFENLKSHDDSKINQKAVNILETYWLEE